jgi:hypothetical protein
MTSDVGSLYRSSLEVRDVTGALVAAATKVLTVTLPDQTTATPAVTTDAPGLYHVDYQLMQEGLHAFSWVTTGPVTARTDYENAVAFRSVVGLAELRTFLNVNDTSRDDVLRQIAGAATELAEGIVGTCVIRTITNEHIPGTVRPVIRLTRGPLPSNTAVTSVTSVWPGGPTWPASALMQYPESGTVEPSNGQGFWYGPWTATYQAGRAIVPQRVILAVFEICFDLWATQRMVSSDLAEPSLTETALYETAMSPDYRIPAHAKALLESEAMPGFA